MANRQRRRLATLLSIALILFSGFSYAATEEEGARKMMPQGVTIESDAATPDGDVKYSSDHRARIEFCTS